MFGGSGGTFVIMMDGEYTERPLIVSGGAGGAAAPNGGTNYGISDASITSDAKSGSVTTDMEGRGGTNGGGGEHGSSSGGGNTPGGGAGYMRNGGNSPDRRFRPLPTPAYATKGTNNPADTTAPGTGGTYNYNNRANYNGGFGGGGSGAKNAPGGAGGYSGGGGGVVDGFSGGGGSFVDSERVTNHRVEANNRGLGEVRIRYLGESLIINQDMRENN
uniref:Loricrin n=1 Tax=Ciona intestinalis TaxID=7719 RepID=F6YFS6_CIOIN|nr:loricrin [Ciona intestinalis]|eukprot:XP_018670457.1 loricrin [Ciona intestinalis]